MDIGAYCGAPVVASQGGVVIGAGWNNGYGNQVVLDSGTSYSHLTDIWVAYGQWVNQGDGLGTVGATGWATGCHLHFEVNSGYTDPLEVLP